MRLRRITVYPEATTADNANLLEYVIQLYQMSGPSSALRIPKASDTARSCPEPIVWDSKTAATWIGRMWRDVVQRPLVEEAFKRCPDLAQDLLIMITSGFVDKLADECLREEDPFQELGQGIYL